MTSFKVAWGTSEKLSWMSPSPIITSMPSPCAAAAGPVKFSSKGSSIYKMQRKKFLQSCSLHGFRPRCSTFGRSTQSSQVVTNTEPRHDSDTFTTSLSKMASEQGGRQNKSKLQSRVVIANQVWHTKWLEGCQSCSLYPLLVNEVSNLQR